MQMCVATATVTLEFSSELAHDGSWLARMLVKQACPKAGFISPEIGCSFVFSVIMISMIKSMLKYHLGCGCVSPMISHGLSKEGIPAFQHATKVQFANARGDPKLQMLINPGIHIRWRGCSWGFLMAVTMMK